MTKANFINSSYIESIFIRKGIDFSKKNIIEVNSGSE